MLELKANPNKAGQGARRRGAARPRARRRSRPSSSRKARCSVGDLVVAGEYSGKVRAMLGDKGQTVTEAGPSTPVEVLGLDGVPDAGEVFNVVTDEKAAKALVEHRHDARRKKELAGTRPRVAGEHPRQDQVGRGQGGQGRPQGRRAGLGRGARERADQAVDRQRSASTSSRPASAASPSPTSAWPRRRRRSSSASTSVRPARRSSWPSRKASTSSCTRSSTTPSTT